MAITAVPLPKPARKLSATAPDLASLVQTGRGFLKDDPQSGSILKILAENGFQGKIQEGAKKGHTYNILHAAPSSDFTLIDSWTEEAVDEEGRPRKQTRKAYQFFRIQSESATSPSAPKTEIPVPTPSKPKVQAEKISETPTSKEMMPEVFAQELPKPTTPTPSPTAVPKPITGEKTRINEVVTNKKVPNPTSQNTEKSHMTDDSAKQKQESGNWLRSKLGTRKSTSLFVTTSISQKKSTKNTETYELLKKRFGSAKNPLPIKPAGEVAGIVSTSPLATQTLTPTATPTVPVSSVPKPPGLEVTKKSAEETAREKKKLEFLEGAFGNRLEGALLQEWGKVKNMPAKPFVYPTEYFWGTDSAGKPIERSLENYPTASKQLRGSIVGFLDQLGTRNIDTEKINVGQAIDSAIEHGLI